jgi:hypothetical protein
MAHLQAQNHREDLHIHFTPNIGEQVRGEGGVVKGGEVGR